MTGFSEVRGRTIILDSNILIHYASDGFKERSGNPLRLLANNGNPLAVTPISGVEVLQPENRPEVSKKYLDFLNYLPNVTIHLGYFQNAVTLARDYHRICAAKKIPFQDLLIGAVICSNSFGPGEKPLLLTADRTDFCEPLWITLATHVVPGDEEGKKYTTLYLLEFNTEISSPLEKKDL